MTPGAAAVPEALAVAVAVATGTYCSDRSALGLPLMRTVTSAAWRLAMGQPSTPTAVKSTDKISAARSAPCVFCARARPASPAGAAASSDTMASRTHEPVFMAEE
jgi:hypothetical protein